jgi:uncharacterized protein
MLHRRVIDGLEFARSRDRLSGDWPIADLPRLRNAVQSGTALRYELEGVPEEQGRPALRLKVAGTLQLACQRCLGALEHPLRVDALLLLFDSESDIEAVSLDAETPDSIMATKEMAVRDLIEEEVLLAIPYAPRHEECKSSTDAAGVPGAGPFADLRSLLGTKH